MLKTINTKEHNPLSEISGFSHLVEYYNKHKNTHLREWLSFDQTFEKLGKQGLVGLLNPTKNIGGDKQLKFVFKISQYINYLVQHEYTIMKGLNEISGYCPHFCKAIGTLLCEIDPYARKTGNPFKITTKHPIEKEILLTEYIDNSSKLYNYIRSDKIHDDVIYSTIKQVLMGVAIAQRKKKFTHYDLHSYNIMMKKCNKDVVFLYVLDSENQFCVPTNGHYPVIIDFGFSYINNIDNGPAWPSMAHTDVGFMSDRYDSIADPKLFLVTVAYEIKNKRKNKKAYKFNRVVKNIFGRLKIDWESGWDTGHKKGASDFATEMLKGSNNTSNLFNNYEHYCIDLIQSLIILPLEEQKYSNITENYCIFLKEFVKIENEIGDPFYNLYILKGIVDVAREVRVDYNHVNSRDKAVSYFRRSIFERINHIANYCNPKEIHFEKMLCSLLCFSKNLEGVLFDVIDTRMKNKQKEYDKMPLKSTEQIYGAIEANIQDKYQFNKNTTLFVMNCISEDCSKFELTSDIIDEINSTHSLSKGTLLYSLINKKHD
jgi:hypothetical protein